MKEARRLSFFGMDPRSTVYEREGRIFRANIDVELSCALLRDPTICSLMDRGALPTTRLIQDQEGSLLLEHQRIAPFTFPGEWSFSMLRDAGLATLALRDELAPAGYELQDAHSYNVGFDGCRPVFIDFASIVPRTTKYLTWRAGGEYRDAFIRILRIWSRANRTAVLGYLNSVWARSDDEALVVHGRHAYRLRSRFRRVRDKSLIATAMRTARLGASVLDGQAEVGDFEDPRAGECDDVGGLPDKDVTAQRVDTAFSPNTGDRGASGCPGRVRSGG